MKRLYPLFVLSILLLNGYISVSQEDTVQYIRIEGNVVDSKTGKPVIYTDIMISGTNTGTVANADGEFTLKVPVIEGADSVTFSSIGYLNKTFSIEQLKPDGNLIQLTPVTVDLAEIYIRPGDARELLLSALNNIRFNYRSEPYMATAFYREIIQRKRKYVAVSEAVLDAYKSSYTKPFDKDRIKILKARKSSDFQKKDTLALKLRGGPYLMFLLDFVKTPGELLQRDVLQYYEYKISGQVIIDNRLAYVISFVQLPEVDVPLYEGKFYIEAGTLTFLGAEFRINDERINKASQYMVKQKPPGVEVDIKKAAYNVNYRYFAGKWYLAYVHTNLELFMRWKKKHFRSKYSLVAEMAITDMDTVNVTKYKSQNTVKPSDVLIEQVGNFEDPDFWGDYNIIHPEEPIQSAIVRMGRKLRRKTNREKEK